MAKNNMKRFIGFVTKEFYHIFRDKRSMFILFGMPIAQIMLFGFAITNEINNVNIAILDQSKDNETQKIINKISASSYFKINEEITNENQIESVFKKGKVKAVLVFEKDFIKNLQTLKQAKVQVITDATDPNIANTISNYVNAILQNYTQEINKNNKPSHLIQTQTQLYYNPELKSVFNFVPGVMTIILMLVSAMMTSISITREKELGTMEVLLVSPLKPFQVIIGKVFPYIFLVHYQCDHYFAFGLFCIQNADRGKLIFIGIRKYFVHYNGTFVGYINIDGFQFATNRYDAFLDGIDAACHHPFGIYFSYFEYAFAFANHQQYCTG